MENKFCKCGCGTLITSKWQKYQNIEYIKGHARKNKHNTLEHNKIISEKNKKGKYKICDYCKKDFYIQKCNLERKKFCSKECYNLSMIGRKIPKESIEKGRLMRIGHEVSETTRKKIGIANSGENNGRWEEITIGKLKKAIRIRDNQICMLCGIHKEKLNKSLDVHHIDYNEDNNLPQNMISLCHPCHARTNKSKREYWTKHFNSLLSDRYGYKYLENQDILIELNGLKKAGL